MELLGVGAKTKSNLWTHDATRIPLPVYGVMLSVTAQQLTLGSGVDWSVSTCLALGRRGPFSAENPALLQATQNSCHQSW